MATRGLGNETQSSHLLIYFGFNSFENAFFELMIRTVQQTYREQLFKKTLSASICKILQPTTNLAKSGKKCWGRGNAVSQPRIFERGT